METKELSKAVRSMFPGVEFKVKFWDDRFDITWSGNIPPSNAEVADALLAQNIPAVAYNTAWSKKARHCVVVVTKAEHHFDLDVSFKLVGGRWTRRPLVTADYGKDIVAKCTRMSLEEKNRDAELTAKRAAHVTAARLWS